MSASNHNWVCFECRTATRKPKRIEQIPKCLSCHKDCFCLGYKVEIPKSDDVKAWVQLQKKCEEKENELRAKQNLDQVRRRHELEKEIARMEALAENKDRNRQIKMLKEELADLISNP